VLEEDEEMVHLLNDLREKVSFRVIDPNNNYDKREVK
jgi:hypothetical protein